MENERNGREPLFEQLREPDLSYYLALRAKLEAARVRQETFAEALQVFMVELWARYGLRPEDGIDPRGRLERAPSEPAHHPDDILLPAGQPAEIQP